MNPYRTNAYDVGDPTPPTSFLHRRLPTWLSAAVIAACLVLSAFPVYAVTPALRLNGVDMTNVSYPTGNLRLELGNVGGTAGYGIMGRMTPTDAGGAATWYDTVSAATFFGTKLDWVRDIGWNLTANGARVDTADAAIGDQWESHYDADATHSWVERHVVFIGTDGTYQRPWTIQVARTASANPIGYTNFGLAADVLWVSGSATAATQNFTFLNPTANAAGQLQVANNSQIRLMNNNQPQLVQVNAAGSGTFRLAMLDGSNNVQLGDTTTAAILQGTSVSINGTGITAIASAGNAVLRGSTGVYIGDSGTSAINIGHNGAIPVNLGRGTVTQATSAVTGVTVNTPSGVITTFSETLAALSSLTFVVTNSSCVSTSVVNVTIGNYSGTYFTNGTPEVQVSAVASGNFTVRILNVHATAALAGTLKINYTVM